MLCTSKRVNSLRISRDYDKKEKRKRHMKSRVTSAVVYLVPVVWTSF